MKRLISALLRDEQGFILSAETVLLGTVGVIGATVGLSAVSHSVNAELTDVAFAFRSLDQSFEIEGTSGCGARVAGSKFQQQPVEQSLNQLREEIERARHREREQMEKNRQVTEQMLREEHQAREKHEAEMRRADAERREAELRKNKDGDPQPPTLKKPEKPKPAKKNKNRKPKDEEISV